MLNAMIAASYVLIAATLTVHATIIIYTGGKKIQSVPFFSVTYKTFLMRSGYYIALLTALGFVIGPFIGFEPVRAVMAVVLMIVVLLALMASLGAIIRPEYRRRR